MTAIGNVAPPSAAPGYAPRPASACRVADPATGSTLEVTTRLHRTRDWLNSPDRNDPAWCVVHRDGGLIVAQRFAAV